MLTGCCNEVVEKETVKGTVQSFYTTESPNPTYQATANMYLAQQNLPMWSMYLSLANANPVYHYHTTFEIKGYEGTHELELSDAPEIGGKYQLTLNKVYKDGELVKSYFTL